MKKVYLAGPDVFFANAAEHFQSLKQACAQVGLEGVIPSDGGICAQAHESRAPSQVSQTIYAANLELIRGCDAVLANLMPFRNAIEPDSGTCFEVGFAVALGKPVVGLFPDLQDLHEYRVVREAGRSPSDKRFDQAHGYLIEAFGLPLNLMLAHSAALFEDRDKALAHLASLLGVR